MNSLQGSPLFRALLALLKSLASRAACQDSTINLLAVQTSHARAGCRISAILGGPAGFTRAVGRWSGTARHARVQSRLQQPRSRSGCCCTTARTEWRCAARGARKWRCPHQAVVAPMRQQCELELMQPDAQCHRHQCQSSSDDGVSGRH